MNLIFENNWRESDKAIMTAAALVFGQALARRTGLTPEESFQIYFGNEIYRASYSLQKKYRAFTYPEGIMSVRPGMTEDDIPDLLHEFGHVLDTTLIGSLRRPSKILELEGVFDFAGNKITGTKGILYYRFMGKRSPFNGYRSGRLSRWIRHPVYWDFGNTPTEDFCDLLLNWIMNSFEDNPAGVALWNWAECHMDEWLSLILLKLKGI